MPIQTKGIVAKNRKIKSLYFVIEIYCPSIVREMKPGKFIMIKISSHSNYPFLRRPFSIYKSYPQRHPEKKKRGHLLILYKVVGKGTQMMTEFKKGQKVDMIGPLGNGFTLPPLPSSANIVLIGGGVGIVSLYPLAEALGSKKLFVFIGGKTRNDILCLRDFKKLNSNIFIATEDGSQGFKGTVIDLFLSERKKFNKNEPYYLYSCGPLEMLKALAKVLKPKRFISQVSLETRMACGFGACWGCVVKTKDLKTPYQRVCKNGPVFNLEEIVWE
jgi:dihydroorotate dehydrogenase electron transfer subunit